MTAGFLKCTLNGNTRHISITGDLHQTHRGEAEWVWEFLYLFYSLLSLGSQHRTSGRLGGAGGWMNSYLEDFVIAM